jgi:hypothetical protein
MTSKYFLSAIVLGGFLTGIAAAQPVGAGLKVGALLTDAFSVGSFNPLRYISDTHRYVIGPFVDFRLPGRFGVEVDALYRSFEYSSTQGSVSAGFWEFPVLAKYKLLGGPVKPYIEGGLVLSHLSVKDVIELNHRSNYGITLGAGFEIHALFLRITPEIRYEGFVFRQFDSPGDVLRSNRNQALFMVGVSF